MGPIDLVERLLDTLAPPDCAGCKKPSVPGRAFCPECAAAIVAPVERPPTLGVPLLVAGTYAGPIASAVVSMKYGGRYDVASRLGRWLADQVGPLFASWAEVTLVPVPLHPRRLAERGYNQSALLARKLARRTGAKLDCLSLRRLVHGPRQAELGRQARLANLVGGFAAARDLGELNVVLIDDVVTTGATAAACLSALKAAHAVPRAVIAVARTERNSRA